MTVAKISRNPVYLRRKPTLVSVYRSTGDAQPGLPRVSEETKARAPWYREMWFGCEDTPLESKVMMASMVALGAVRFSEEDFCVARRGAKALLRRAEILEDSQVVVMESGKSLGGGR